MAYNFENSNRFYNRVLKQLEDPNKSRMDYQKQYGQYKLGRPKNQIRTRSIYTQQQSQYFGMNTKHEQDNDQDIHQFLQNSKTLRQKITQKLQKKKKTNKKQKIAETTFRPNQVKEQCLKQNCIMNRSSYKKIYKDYPNTKKESNNQRQSVQRIRVKTQRCKDKKRVMTQVEQANALWNAKAEKNMTQLDFYERQQKTLTNRKQVARRLQQQKKQKQLEGCTFRPKLTKYKPKRS